jgi:hypothetical protein
MSKDRTKIKQGSHAYQKSMIDKTRVTCIAKIKGYSSLPLRSTLSSPCGAKLLALSLANKRRGCRRVGLGNQSPKWWKWNWVVFYGWASRRVRPIAWAGEPVDSRGPESQTTQWASIRQLFRSSLFMRRNRKKIMSNNLNVGRYHVSKVIHLCDFIKESS